MSPRRLPHLRTQVQRSQLLLGGYLRLLEGIRDSGHLGGLLLSPLQLVHDPAELRR